MTYAEYLQTTWWRCRRYQALNQVGFRCQRCGRRGFRNPYGHYGLDVHHRRYDHLWHELPDDLVVLCRSCHDDAHEISNGLDLRLLRKTIQAGRRA
jgi:predicted HNH restriction endonuclease